MIFLPDLVSHSNPPSVKTQETITIQTNTATVPMIVKIVGSGILNNIKTKHNPLTNIKQNLKKLSISFSMTKPLGIRNGGKRYQGANLAESLRARLLDSVHSLTDTRSDTFDQTISVV